MMNNYIIKHCNNDFKVEEITLFPKKNNGKISIFELEKSNITTFSAIKTVQNKFNIKEIGYCGLKDEYAITTQKISIDTQNINIDRINIELKDGYIKLKKIDDGFSEHLKIGRLLGNKFKITIRNINDSTLKDFKAKYPKRKIYINYINYYDEQRFGLPNDVENTHIIGKYILNHNYEAAFNEILLTKSEYKNNLINEYNAHLSYKSAISILPMNVLTFYLNSYMSFIWNEKAQNIISSLMEQDYINCYDYVCNNFSTKFLCYDTNFQTIPGSNTLEYEYYLNKNEKRSSLRKLINNATVFVSDISEDEFFTGKYKIELNFMLDSGNYATMLIKQLMGVLK